MTRYAVDAPVALLLVERDLAPAQDDRLVAPSVLRSDVLRLLYQRVRSGDLAETEGRLLLDSLATLPVRLLSDRVSRATAWRITHELGWDDPGPAEYLAVARLQADVLVTADPVLLSGANGLVATAAPAALLPH